MGKTLLGYSVNRLFLCLLLFMIVLSLVLSVTGRSDAAVMLFVHVLDGDGQPASSIRLTFIINGVTFQGFTDSGGVLNVSRDVSEVDDEFRLEEVHLVNHTLAFLNTTRSYDPSFFNFSSTMSDDEVIVMVRPKVEVIVPSTRLSSVVILRLNLTVLRGFTATPTVLDPYSGENISSKVATFSPAVQVGVSRVFVPLCYPVNFSIEATGEAYNVTAKFSEPTEQIDLTASLSEKVAAQSISSVTTVLESVRAYGSIIGTAEYEKMRNLYLRAVDSFREGDVEDGIFRMRQARAFLRTFEATIYRFKIVSNLSASVLLVLVGMFSSVVSRLVEEWKRRILVGLVVCLSLVSLLALFQSSVRLTIRAEEDSYWGLKILSFSLITFAGSYVVFEALTHVGRFALYGRLTLLQLMRRRLRTVLTVTAIFMVVFSMSLFMSISFSSALIKRPLLHHPLGPSGLIITKNRRFWASAESVGTSALQPYEADWFSSRSWIEYTGVFKRLSNLIVEAEGVPIGGWFLMATNVTSFKVLGSTAGGGFIAVSPNFIADQYNVSEFMVGGGFLSDEDPHGILLPDNIAEKFDIQVGDCIELRRADRVTFDKRYGVRLPQLVANLRVRGIFSKAKIESLKDIDGSSLFDAFGEEILVLASVDAGLPYSFDKLTVIVTDDERVTALAEDLAYLGYNVVAVQEGRAYSYTVSDVLVTQGWEMIIVPIVLAFLTLTTHLYRSVYERERNITTLTLVGANPSHIRNMVMIESATLMIIGTILGYILSFPFSEFLNLFSGPSSGTLLFFNQDPQTLFMVLLTSALLSMAGSLLPVRKAIAISVVSRFLKPRFDRFFSEDGYGAVSVLPFKFAREHLGTLTLAIDRFLKKRHGGWLKPVVYALGEMKREQSPDKITYEISRVGVDYHGRSVEFQTVITLSLSRDQILIKIKLTPSMGWGTLERKSATKVIEILRAYFLNLLEHPLKGEGTIRSPT